MIHPGGGRGGLSGSERQEVDQVPAGAELDQLGLLVHVVEAHPEDGRVEALGGRLVADPQNDVVQLQHLEQRAIGRSGHRRECRCGNGFATAPSEITREAGEPAPRLPGRRARGQVERERDRPRREDRDVDGDGPPVEPRELQRGEVPRGRRLGADPRLPSLGQQHVPRVHRARQGQPEHDGRAPAEGARPAPGEDHHDEPGPGRPSPPRSRSSPGRGPPSAAPPRAGPRGGRRPARPGTRERAGRRGPPRGARSRDREERSS